MINDKGLIVSGVALWLGTVFLTLVVAVDVTSWPFWVVTRLGTAVFLITAGYGLRGMVDAKPKRYRIMMEDE